MHNKIRLALRNLTIVICYFIGVHAISRALVEINPVLWIMFTLFLAYTAFAKEEK